jgi:L-iditol 2-dehydrogenase
MEGALIEPLSVGFHAAMQGEARVGQSALVFGAGCIGLVSLLALKAMGVAEVYVLDVLDKRLDMAMKLGATGVINSKEVNAVEKIKEIFGTRGVDLAIETSGAEIAAQQSVDMVKKGGTIVMVGYSATGMVTLPMSNLLNKEITIKTVFRYRHIYPLAIKAVSEGKVNLKQIVSTVFDFDDVQKAMDYCIQNKADITKGVIKL